MSPLDDVDAVVLTHRRERLASQTVQVLVDQEGVPPERVTVVVNGEGGLSHELEAAVDLVRLTSNLGPAGGFAAGLERVRQRSARPWVYVCEDDMALLEVERPVLRAMIERAESWRSRHDAPIGAVVSYGRCVDQRSGRTYAYQPGPACSWLEPVDCAAWGATLVHRSVLDAAVLPDADLFFGYEDFDWFFSVRREGFHVLCDTVLARMLNDQVTVAGRREAQRGQRPDEDAERWRNYYIARNFLEIARRHGRPSWSVWHLVLSVRRWQLGGYGLDLGRAILRGLVDGQRGRLGPSARYQRQQGEL